MPTVGGHDVKIILHDNQFYPVTWRTFADVSSATSGVHRSASEPTFVTNNHKVSTTSVPDNRELDSVHILNNLQMTASEQGWDTGNAVIYCMN